jgi:hypothetical protein
LDPQSKNQCSSGTLSGVLLFELQLKQYLAINCKKSRQHINCCHTIWCLLSLVLNEWCSNEPTALPGTLSVLRHVTFWAAVEKDLAFSCKESHTHAVLRSHDSTSVATTATPSGTSMINVSMGQ